jgi:hypothetical protein
MISSRDLRHSSRRQERQKGPTSNTDTHKITQPQARARAPHRRIPAVELGRSDAIFLLDGETAVARLDLVIPLAGINNPGHWLVQLCCYTVVVPSPKAGTAITDSWIPADKEGYGINIGVSLLCNGFTGVTRLRFVVACACLDYTCLCGGWA